ncbi:MAG: hypothetical protein PWQ08_1110 [Clostridiales bacterium]|jgi:hypothetical protein|nr:hypothetical protein [Clostridiales bacterium]
MAMKGHNRQGYALITETKAADGTVTETITPGTLTTHVVNFTGARGASPVESYAGDELEDEEQETTGDVKIELSQLSLKDEAAFGGHTYNTETNKMSEKKGDTPPFMRYCAIGVGRSGETKSAMADFYRLLMYYKVKFSPVDDNLKTREKMTTFQNHTASGTCFPNCDGNIREKQDFATFPEALAAAKTFLNIAST